MNLKSISKAVGGAAIALATLSSHAAISLTNADGVFNNFLGIDWSSSGVAWTNDFVPVDGATFNLYYVAHAVQVYDVNEDPFALPGMDTSANGNFGTRTYEYTIVAKIQERVDSCSGTGFECTFQVMGGDFTIYYDPKVGANANRNPGGAATGYGDGTKLIEGSMYQVTNPAEFNTFNNATGGQVTLNGSITYTNGAFINPALGGTTFVSTLQLIRTGAQPPTSVDTGADYDGVVNLTGVTLQADGNQTFHVPEPGVLALGGLALLGLGAARRRKAAR